MKYIKPLVSSESGSSSLDGSDHGLALLTVPYTAGLLDTVLI